METIVGLRRHGGQHKKQGDCRAGRFYNGAQHNKQARQVKKPA
jgi:hypothetical protein